MTQTRYAIILMLAAAALVTGFPAPTHADQPAARESLRSVVVSRYQRNRENRFEKTHAEVRTVKVATGGLIELHNVAGDIIVTAGGSDTARIEITRIARGTSDADAQEMLKVVPVEIIEAAGRVEVWARYPHSRRPGTRRNINVSTVYRVTAPAGTRIKTESVSGSVSVTGIRGELALGTISGNIRVQDAGRVVSGRTISGNVEVVSAQNDAVIELASTSGNVTAQGIKVRRLDLGTVSGSVYARDLQCDLAKLHSVSGDIEYAGALTPSGRYELRSHSGDVRLSLAGGVGFEIEASTFSGEVRSGLKIRVESQSGRRTRTIRGVFGDGGARISATSFSGNVVINGR